MKKAAALITKMNDISSLTSIVVILYSSWLPLFFFGRRRDLVILYEFLAIGGCWYSD